jgi:hypothetical protein
MLDQKTRKQLQSEFHALEPQLKQQFPELEQRDFERMQSDPDDFIRAIARKSGKDEAMIERRVTELVQAGSGR